MKPNTAGCSYRSTYSYFLLNLECIQMQVNWSLKDKNKTKGILTFILVLYSLWSRQKKLIIKVLILSHWKAVTHRHNATYENTENKISSYTMCVRNHFTTIVRHCSLPEASINICTYNLHINIPHASHIPFKIHPNVTTLRFKILNNIFNVPITKLML